MFIHNALNNLQKYYVPNRSKSQIFLSLPMLAFLVSCGGSDSTGGGNGGGTAFTQQAALVTNIATIMDAGFAQLNGSVATAKTSVGLYCDSVTGVSVGDAALRTAAQSDFNAAMLDLQHSVMHSLGPAKADNQLLQLYSWPTTSTCAIDTELAAGNTALVNSVNRRGMDALEYLLFVAPSDNHKCSTSTAQLDAFNVLDGADKQVLRCAFMLNVVDDAAASANVLANAWDASQGNYIATMKTDPNPTAVLNTVTDAMFYFEEILKEFKLDAPLGGGLTNTAPSCGPGTPCPEDVESSYARISKENLLANMLAFQQLYLGGTPAQTTAIGFDDWLKADGNDVMADKFATDIQRVIDALNAMSDSLFDTITGDIATVNSLLQGPVQDVSKALRFDVMPELALNLPAGSASDTD